SAEQLRIAAEAAPVKGDTSGDTSACKRQDASRQARSMGIATVYRFLRDKKRTGEVRSYLCNRKTVYTTSKMSHCHFVCEKTGEVIHFDVDSLDFMQEKIPGTISSFQIEVRGTCEECVSDMRARSRRNPAASAKKKNQEE
ncbi:hypothetical protein COY28_01355, partial [Candidatus Woesearchaeota archaeon CG_4_10_14_0_2_um_filter_57_5]